MPIRRRGSFSVDFLFRQDLGTAHTTSNGGYDSLQIGVFFPVWAMRGTSTLPTLSKPFLLAGKQQSKMHKGGKISARAQRGATMNSFEQQRFVRVGKGGE